MKKFLLLISILLLKPTINDLGELIIESEFENVIHHFKSTLSKKEAQYVYDH